MRHILIGFVSTAFVAARAEQSIHELRVVVTKGLRVVEGVFGSTNQTVIENMNRDVQKGGAENHGRTQQMDPRDTLEDPEEEKAHEIDQSFQHEIGY